MVGPGLGSYWLGTKVSTNESSVWWHGREYEGPADVIEVILTGAAGSAASPARWLLTVCKESESQTSSSNTFWELSGPLQLAVRRSIPHPTTLLYSVPTWNKYFSNWDQILNEKSQTETDFSLWEWRVFMNNGNELLINNKNLGSFPGDISSQYMQ